MTLLLAAVGSSAWCQDVKPVAAVAVVSSVVKAGEMHSNDLWFSLSWNELRFETHTVSIPDAKLFWGAILDSNKSGNSLTVHFDPNAGRIDPKTQEVIFAPIDIVYEGKIIRGGDNEAGGIRAPGEAEFLRGIGLSYSTQHEAAENSLAAAGGDHRLPTKLRGLALSAKTQIESDDALSRFPAGPDRDRLLLAAYADAKLWARLETDDPQAGYSVAFALQYLGADGEALVAFAAIKRKWPSEDFWTTIRTAAIYRNQGKFDWALSALDDLKVRTSWQDGMPFRYHRGWTLIRMGRLHDAVDELTQGLKYQPDYAPALNRRACALAESGNLTDALTDQIRFVELMGEEEKSAGETPRGARGFALAKSELASLQGLIAVNPLAKSGAPCAEGFEELDTHRARSSLLPATGTP